MTSPQELAAELHAAVIGSPYRPALDAAIDALLSLAQASQAREPLTKDQIEEIARRDEFWFEPIGVGANCFKWNDFAIAIMAAHGIASPAAELKKD